MNARSIEASASLIPWKKVLAFSFVPFFLLSRLIAFSYVVIRLPSILRRVFSPFLPYDIEEDIKSSATRVMVTRSKRTGERICLKVWRPCDVGVYHIKDVMEWTRYFVEGLELNRRFADDVFLGIAPVKPDDGKTVYRGSLVRKPHLEGLEKGVHYALVMKYLEKDWRLDLQLQRGHIHTPADIEFLAQSIIPMHKQLEPAPKEMGTPEAIEDKLALNSGFLDEALDRLIGIYSGKYRMINSVMFRACKAFAPYFKKRCEQDAIKHCHGDLKATNLYVRPERLEWFDIRTKPRQLLALDSIDFNPKLYNIDRLSDLAMLAVDVELFMPKWSKKNSIKCSEEILCRSPVEHFLNIYLQHIEGVIRGTPAYQETRAVLEYYITEKCVVSAYVAIMYTNNLVLGKRYLDAGLTHARTLEKLVQRFSTQEELCSSFSSDQSRLLHA